MDEDAEKLDFSKYEQFHDAYVSAFVYDRDNAAVKITLSNIYRLDECEVEQFFPDGDVLVEFFQVKDLECEGVLDGASVMSFVKDKSKFILTSSAGVLCFQGNLASVLERLND